MKLGSMLGAVAAVSVLAFAGQAAASTWVATYKGHVSGGYDETGVFGTAGTDLSGLAFTATFTYDLDAGSVTALADGERADLAVLSAILYVGDGLYDFGSGAENHIETHTGSLYGFGPGFVFHQTLADFNFSAIFRGYEQLLLAGGTAAPGALAQAVAEIPVINPGDGGPADYVGSFQIDSNYFGFEFRASADLRPESYSVSEVTSGGVPEPATWALMILGFGSAGATLRRRRPALA